MPHKMNTRSCERVNGLAVVLRGHLSMLGELAGDQWNEGDVSCSVVRRVALPDAFFADRRAVPDLPHRARRVRCLPGRGAARAGPVPAVPDHDQGAHGRRARRASGARQAHEAIKEHAVAVALEMRQGLARNDLFDRLAADPRLGLSEEQIDALVADPIEFTGAARDQVAGVVRRDRGGRGRRPGRGRVRPGAIL